LAEYLIYNILHSNLTCLISLEAKHLPIVKDKYYGMAGMGV